MKQNQLRNKKNQKYDNKKRSNASNTKEPISFSEKNTTYLGQKGYTLLKSEFDEKEQELLKTMLLAKPIVNGNMSSDSMNSFPIYRESANKFYVPRYFGEKHFGKPKETKLPEGDNINIEFLGSMRDLQKVVIEKYLNHVSIGSGGGGGGLLELYCGFGKTICALNIISRIKKKTLIIVHKEFLMNQWIERIEQFLPNARIGKIQGQINDTKDKDIVIGMLQSLSMKEYPSSTFESFGMTIIDEVHHISSQVFSCALFKIITKYMLGLSATMNRKDGTTEVFKMFLGDVVYKGVREDEFNVSVQAIQYACDDPDFNEVLTDYCGNVMFSSMISKLCGYNRRSEFIINIVKDMLYENADQQIIILAHNRNLLEYLHDSIQNNHIATVGYYVGGMKESALKESETKKVIIATYSMAAEALDIKTLTSLIMATPKTDIEQAVGRILRDKNGTKIVVDIIDQHTPFKNQWNKRRAFYKKQNYKIFMGNKYIPKSKWFSEKKVEKTEEVDEENEESTDTIEMTLPTTTTKKCMIDLSTLDNNNNNNK
jgi:superfamily II DNA or RNA helicase